jgi:hypothetical protein
MPARLPPATPGSVVRVTAGLSVAVSRRLAAEQDEGGGKGLPHCPCPWTSGSSVPGRDGTVLVPVPFTRSSAPGPGRPAGRHRRSGRSPGHPGGCRSPCSCGRWWCRSPCPVPYLSCRVVSSESVGGAPPVGPGALPACGFGGFTVLVVPGACASTNTSPGAEVHPPARAPPPRRSVGSSPTRRPLPPPLCGGCLSPRRLLSSSAGGCAPRRQTPTYQTSTPGATPNARFLVCPMSHPVRLDTGPRT